MEKKSSKLRKIILCPVDFSAPSEAALKQLARYYAKDSGLILFHVCTRNPPECSDAVKNRYKMFSSYIKILNQYDCIYQLDVQELDGYGSPADVIVAYAKKRKADMISIGSHGESDIPYLVMGSTAETVVRYADCPVLLIKTLHEAKTEEAGVGGEKEGEKTEGINWF